MITKKGQKLVKESAAPIALSGMRTMGQRLGLGNQSGFLGQIDNQATNMAHNLSRRFGSGNFSQDLSNIGSRARNIASNPNVQTGAVAGGTAGVVSNIGS